MKKAYELTAEEISLVEGFRQGQLMLPEEWLRVSPREREAILIWRRMGFGSLTLQLKAGEPVELEAIVHARLGQGQDEERVELVRELRLAEVA